jgi:hypothetical protein
MMAKKECTYCGGTGQRDCNCDDKSKCNQCWGSGKRQ